LVEREEISRGLAAGLSLRAIASQLGRAASTISREDLDVPPPQRRHAPKVSGLMTRNPENDTPVTRNPENDTESGFLQPPVGARLAILGVSRHG